MSAAIFYFSATGNSLVVAKDLAQELGSAELIPITKALKDQSEQPFDLIGVVYPVYMFGLPLIVADFFKKIKINPKAYIFGVATLGGLPGRAHSISKSILRKRGLNLAAGFSVLMPGNYTPLYGAITQEKQHELFSKEKLRIKEIAQAITVRKGILEEKPFLMNFLLYKLVYAGGVSKIPLSGRGFQATEACTRCGLCAKICPVENIELIEGRPIWLNRCQHCMACLQWCPVEAVQYNKTTIGRKRYHHPGISAEDIMEQR